MSDLPTTPPEEPRRCPRLGGPVGFSYCLKADPAGPCFKILDCWWEIFDVVGHLTAVLGDRAVDRLARRPPPDKVAGLVEQIRRARSRLQGRGPEER